MESAEKILNREKNFHNKFSAKINVASIDVKCFFEGSTSPENRFIMKNIGDIKNKKILDIGCGAGEAGVYFALKGADCTLADLSEGMLEKALELAKKYNVNIKTKLIDANYTEFSENSFDVVYAANLLHHVDAEKTLNEIYKILKPEGILCFWDPLKHNPLINIYRKIAKNVRSYDERPLDINIVNLVKKKFTKVEYDTFWLASLWIFVSFYAIEKNDPNKEPYWKKIIIEEQRLKKTYQRLEKIDELIKKISFMKKFAWNVVVVAKK